MAVWKPNLGHCTGRESTFLTWCQSLHIFDQKITESLAIRLGPKVLLSTPLGIFWNKLGIFKSEPTVHTNFGKYQKILLEMEYFEIVLRKILRKFNIIFYSNCCEKQELVTIPPSQAAKYVQKFCLFCGPPSDYFWCFNWKGVLGLFPKLEFVVYKNRFLITYIIIPLSVFSWNHKTLDKKEEIFKSFRWNKRAF